MALSPVIGKLRGRRVVLASASPRRQDILRHAGLRFEVVPSRFEETLRKSGSAEPAEYALGTARGKALEVAARVHQKDLRTPDMVIAADTIVAIDGLILEKPVDKQDAYRMLSRLSGREHSVFTGVCVLCCWDADGELRTRATEFLEETKVKFSELSEELLWEYVHSGEPMDKAGGYGIQAMGGMLVERVCGDFLNVVGFPLNRFCKELAQLESGPHDDPGPRNDPRSRNDPRPCDDLQPHRNPEDTVPPDPSGLLRILEGFKASGAVLAACRMKVFDALDGAEPRMARDVASELGTNEAGMQRLLDACAALGLLHETPQGFRCTALSHTYLCSQGPRSLHAYVLDSHVRAWERFSHLHESLCVQEVCPSVRPSVCPSRDAIWDAETLLCKLTAPNVAAAFDLSPFISACHLGGCACALATELARRNPRMAVTVLQQLADFRRVACDQHLGEDATAARVNLVHGDMFESRLPEAELFVLSRIPDLWTDDVVQRLLGKMADAGGRGVLVADAPCAPGCIHGPWRALDLLGDHSWTVGRSEDDVRRVMRVAGFTEVRVATLGDGPDSAHVMLATRDVGGRD